MELFHLPVQRIFHLMEKQQIEVVEKYIAKEEIELIKNAVKATGIDDALRPIYDYLEEKIDYGKIRLALSCLKANGK